MPVYVNLQTTEGQFRIKLSYTFKLSKSVIFYTAFLDIVALQIAQQYLTDDSSFSPLKKSLRKTFTTGCHWENIHYLILVKSTHEIQYRAGMKDLHTKDSEIVPFTQWFGEFCMIYRLFPNGL